MFCPKCGKQVTENVKFCPYCGGEMPTGTSRPAAAPASDMPAVPTPAPDAPVPAPPARKAPKGLLIGIAAVVVIALVAAVAVFALPKLFGSGDFQGTIAVTVPGQTGELELVVEGDGTAELKMNDVNMGNLYYGGASADVSVIGTFERTGSRDASGEYTFAAQTVMSGGVTVELDSIASMYSGYMDPDQVAQLESLLDNLEVTLIIPDGAASGTVEGTWGVDCTELVAAIAELSGQTMPNSSYEVLLSVNGNGSFEVTASSTSGPGVDQVGTGSWTDNGSGSYTLDMDGSELSVQIER